MSNIQIPALLMGILALLSVAVFMLGLKWSIQRTGWTQSKKNTIFYRVLFFTMAWIIIVGALAVKGVFSDFSTLPPRPVILILLPLPVVIYLSFTRTFREIVQQVPLHWLIAFQSFRIAVELLLWQGYQKGIIPVQMSFEGRNFDIAAGILAIITAWIVSRRRGNYRVIARAYHFTGLLLLLNVLIVALLSMPTPFRYFTNEPSLAAVGRFPMIYLPGILVVLAYTAHIFSLRQFSIRKSEDQVETRTVQVKQA
jgi:hypothetical protein